MSYEFWDLPYRYVGRTSRVPVGLQAQGKPKLDLELKKLPNVDPLLINSLLLRASILGSLL